MLEEFLSGYNSLVDRIGLSLGYAPEPEEVRTFGGVPQLDRVGSVIADATSILNGRKYVFLGPYKGAYRKIRAAKQKGKAEVVLTGKDFRYGAVLLNFDEIKRLQDEAKAANKDCLVKDLELILDCATILPDLVITENSP